MNLESSINDVIQEKLQDGTIEKLVAEQLEIGVKKALDSLFGSFGCATKEIEKQLKSVMLPYLEKYDYSAYITKLDSVLVDVLKAATVENRVLLGNFKELLSPEQMKEITVTQLFNVWIKHVEEHVEVDGLEIDLDDTPSYEPVTVTFEIVENLERSWSVLSSSKLIFECEHDEEMNFEIPLSRFRSTSNTGWDISYKTLPTINSLRHLSGFEIFLMRLTQNGTRLIVDESCGDGEAYPDAQPEASFS